MSVIKSPKQTVLLTLILAILAGGFYFFQKSSPEASASAEATENTVAPQPAVIETTVAEAAEPEARPVVDLCATGICGHDHGTPKERKTAPTVQYTEQPSVDHYFKSLAKHRPLTVDSDAFDTLAGTAAGDSLTIDLESITLSGTVTHIRDTSISTVYSLELEDRSGRALITLRDQGGVGGFVGFYGDSRVIIIKDNKEFDGLYATLLSEKTVSDVYCTPPGTVFPLSHPVNKTHLSGFFTSQQKEFEPLVGIAAPIPLNSLPDSDYVLYIDFDGEEVTRPEWDSRFDPFAEPPVIPTDPATVFAEPHPRVNDSSWVTAVWARVAEDFAPFNITVTTDRSVYDAALGTRRVHVVCTPTNDVAPGAGGVAILIDGVDDYQFGSDSPLCWVFNLEEYACASTISHEVGHVMRLNHDGTDDVEYYGGHNDGYTPGWAPIMGAPWADLQTFLYDEVDQWSQGEYEDANNQEDDIAIIGGAANGFGFKTDDFADEYDTTVAPAVGILAIDIEDQVSATGIISSRTDVDIFSFETASGEISLTVSPLDVESEENESGSDTQGANLAVEITLLNSDGDEVASGTSSGPAALASTIEANIPFGVYYLVVEGAGRGADAEVGFSDYASLGQYTVSGNVAKQPLFIEGKIKPFQPVIANSTQTFLTNGTNFGFTTPNTLVTRDFELSNSSDFVITNISISLASGADFQILDPGDIPSFLLPSQPGQDSEVYILSIAFVTDENGLYNDTVLVSYDGEQSEVYDFAISATCSPTQYEDNYETGDIKYSSYKDLTNYEGLLLSEHLGLGWMSDTQDNYRFKVESGDQLITVETFHDPDGGVNEDGDPTDTGGDILFELYRYPNILVATMFGESGSETLQYLIPSTATSDEYYVIVTPLNGIPPEVPFLRNTYDLRWTAEQLGSGDGDLYEDNDFADQAFNMSRALSSQISEILGTATQDDDDWYVVNVPRDPRARFIYALAEFEHDDGNIDIALYDEDFNLLLTSEGEEDEEWVSFTDIISFTEVVDLGRYSPDGIGSVNGIAAGSYYLRVYGDDTGNEYDLFFGTLEDDRYEVLDDETENDSRTDYYDLGTSILNQNLSDIDGNGIIGDYDEEPADGLDIEVLYDEDWYRFEVGGGNISKIEVTFIALDGPEDILTYRVKNIFGNTIPGAEFTTITGFANEPAVLTITNPTESEYLIQVEAPNAAGLLTAYDFRVDVIEGGSLLDGAVEDNYEENDRYNQTFDISGNEGLWLTSIDGYGAHFDPDWYSIEIPENATLLTARVFSDSSLGNIDFHLTNANSVIMASSTDGGNEEEITFDNPPAGEHKIVVFGDRNGNQYNVYWDVIRSEDNYEENDFRLDAFDLTNDDRKLLRKVDGVGIQADADWYRIFVPNFTEELRMSLTFTHDEGDIDLELYNSSGFRVDRSASSTDNEQITYLDPFPGDYFVKIYYDNDSNEYDFSWAALNEAEVARLRIDEDEYEENDTQATAYPLTFETPRLVNLLGLAAQADDDWYEITLGLGNQGLYVECLFDHADGDVDFEIYDSLGSAIIRRESETDNEFYNIDTALPAGTYYIRVYGPNLGTAYDLYWVSKNEDIFEQNDTELESANITEFDGIPLSNVGGYVTQGDDDWYQIDVTGNYPYLKITLEYVELNGNINFDLYGERDNLPISVTTNDPQDPENPSVTDTKTIFVPVDAGTNYIYVYGDDAYNTYELTWELFQDDDFEENDVLGDAADITAEPRIEAVQFDDDWYRIDVPAVGFNLGVLTTFLETDGDIDMELYESDENGGGTLITDAITTEQDFESVSAEVTPGTYYVRVFGDNTNENYVLTWNIKEDDIYDSTPPGNDELDDAADFTGLEETVVQDLVQFDDDWYEIVTQPGEVSIEVLIEFLHADGDLALAIYDAAGTELHSVNSDTDDELLIYGPDPYGAGPTSYFIKVSGQRIGTDYTFTWLSKTEDNYEGDFGNNTFLNASDLILDSEGVRISDTILGYGTSEDEDWYLVTINSGDDGIVIEACFLENYLGGDTNIDIELFDDSVDGEGTPIALFLKRSVDINDVERIHYKGPAGTYYLRVFGDLEGNPYDLFWNSYAEDTLEISDTQPTVYNDLSSTPRNLWADLLNRGEFGGNTTNLELYLLDPLTQLDEDWYEVIVQDGEDIFVVDVKFEHIQGDIDVAIYKDGLLVAQADSETDDEFIRIDNLDTTFGSGTYLVCVYGYGIKNPKEDSTWTFDPFNEDLQTKFYNYDSDNIDLAEGNAYGLANTYTMRWNSGTEDQFDAPTLVDPVNDDIDNPARPGEQFLIDQYGFNDSPAPFGSGDGVVDAIERGYTYTTDNGETGILAYQSEYLFDDLAQFDEDWFEFTLDSGVTVNHQLYVSIDFYDNNRGDLGLEVYKLNTVTNEYESIGQSNGTGNFELVEHFSDTAATYRIQVTGEDVGTPYALTIRAFDDDKFEQNDELDDAFDITGLEGVPLFNILRDEDLFRVEIDKDQVHLYPSVFTLSGRAGYSYQVLDAAGDELPNAYRTSPTAFVISPSAATYYIRVVGEVNGTSYFLTYSVDNIDEYDLYTANNNSSTAEDLTRNRLEPTWSNNTKYLLPIQELKFDYSLAGRLSATNPLDPFGHSTQTDDDWYALKIPSWSLETVRVGNASRSEIKRIFNVRLNAAIEFTHDDGNIDMEIYEDDGLGGITPLGRAIAAGSVDNELIPENDFYSDRETLSVPVDPTDEQKVYYIKVSGDNRENSYELEWSVTLEDVYENNNFVEQAYNHMTADTTNEGESTEGQWLHEVSNLADINGDGEEDILDEGFKTRKGYGNQRTDDWYAVAVSDGSSAIEVKVMFFSDNNQAYTYGPDDVDLDFEVYRLTEIPGTDIRKPVLVGRSTDGSEVNKNTATPEFPSVGFPVSADMTQPRFEPPFDSIIEASDRDTVPPAVFPVDGEGIYFIRIYYDNGYKPYSFWWDDVGDVDGTDDTAIITDYIDGYANGDWRFALDVELPETELLNNASADLDGDNYPNWAEYALALNPAIPDFAVVGQSIVEIDGKDYYQFEYLRTKEAAARGYEFIVEETSTLVFDGSEAVFVRTESVDDEIERVFYRCSKPLDEQDRCFFKLRVLEPTAKGASSE